MHGGSVATAMSCPAEKSLTTAAHMNPNDHRKGLMLFSEIIAGAPGTTSFSLMWILSAAVLFALAFGAVFARSSAPGIRREKLLRTAAIALFCLAIPVVVQATIVTATETATTDERDNIKNANFQRLAEERYGLQLDEYSYDSMKGSEKEVPASRRDGSVVLVKLVKFEDKVLLFSGGQELPIRNPASE